MSESIYIEADILPHVPGRPPFGTVRIDAYLDGTAGDLEGAAQRIAKARDQAEAKLRAVADMAQTPEGREVADLRAQLDKAEQAVKDAGAKVAEATDKRAEAIRKRQPAGSVSKALKEAKDALAQAEDFAQAVRVMLEEGEMDLEELRAEKVEAARLKLLGEAHQAVQAAEDGVRKALVDPLAAWQAAREAAVWLADTRSVGAAVLGIKPEPVEPVRVPERTVQLAPPQPMGGRAREAVEGKEGPDDPLAFVKQYEVGRP